MKSVRTAKTTVQTGPRPVTPAKERGFVAVTTALLMVVLLLFMAMAIDVAIWFYRGAQLQRTADAAALAGVTRMPKFDSAELVAKDIAAKNRLDPNLVTVQRVPNSPRELQVSITDPAVPSFFGRMLRNNLVMKRTSRAEFVSAITLGSQVNGVGTGSFPGYGPSGNPQNFWLAINGYCTPKEYGDRFAAGFDGNITPITSRCDPGVTVQNTEYGGDYYLTGRPAYTYAIDVPCPVANQDPCTTDPAADTEVYVYNPHFDRSDTGLDANVAMGPLFDLSQVTTTFAVVDEAGNFVMNRVTNTATPVDFATCDGATCAGINDWVHLATIPRTAHAGRFRVEVSTKNAEANSYGANVFSLVAYPASQGLLGPCVAGPLVCPAMSGEKSMSVYANVSGGQTDFFLAKLSPARYYRGKKIQILLSDVDQGASGVQILEPGGAPTAFSYRTWSPGITDSSVPVDDPAIPRTNTVGPNHVLDVSTMLAAAAPAALPPWPPASRMGQQLFNGRTLSLELNIPTNYGCVTASSPCVEAPLLDDGWWKIRYTTAAGTVSDRTTWTVQLVGDPVHLRH